MSPATLAAMAGGALVIAGVLVIVAAWRNVDLLPQRPAGRPHRRRCLVRWRSRRTAVEAATATAAAVTAWALTGWPVAGLAMAAAILALPRLWRDRTAQTHIARLEALESWTRHLADTLTAGTGLEDALLATADDPPGQIATAVTGLRRRLEYRVGTEDALRAFADELAGPVGDTIAASLIVASRMRGRGLHQVLTTLADTVAKDVAMQRQIDAERATHRTTAIWVVAALGLFVGFAVLNRAYVAPFGTATGQLMLLVVTALYGGGIFWLYRLAAPERGFRFLPKHGRQR